MSAAPQPPVLDMRPLAVLRRDVNTLQSRLAAALRSGDGPAAVAITYDLHRARFALHAEQRRRPLAPFTPAAVATGLEGLS